MGEQKFEWFDAARMGLFVHWGPYSVAGRHEQVMLREGMTPEEYEVYAQYFDGDLFDAEELLKKAKSAGAGYAVLTAKHHDGFCLWDSHVTDYKATSFPLARDILREWVEACRALDLKVGVYYSLLDWHHPDFLIDGVHPQRYVRNLNELNEGRVWERYREYLHAQVRELLEEYGPIDYLFFDFSYSEGRNGLPGKGAKAWDSQSLVEMIRELSPTTMINDRLELPGDVGTPEQHIPVEGTGQRLKQRWESCQTINGSWGYFRDNQDYRSAATILRNLVECVAGGGNLLLNVGPDARGQLDSASDRVLNELGEWMRLHRHTVIGGGPSSAAKPPQGTMLVEAWGRTFLHLSDWRGDKLALTDLARPLRFARLVNDGSELPIVGGGEGKNLMNEHTIVQTGNNSAVIQLPRREPEVLLPVVELVF